MSEEKKLTNQDIIDKLDRIIQLDYENFCNLIIDLKTFEPIYKTTDFYKITKMPLDNLFKSYTQFKQVDRLIGQINYQIDNFDGSHLDNLIDRVNDSIKNLKGDFEQSSDTLKQFIPKGE